MKYAAFLLFLAACGQTPVFTPVEVEIPVAVACPDTAILKPDFALNHAAASDTLAEKTKAALVELNQRRAYEALLESQIAACR